MLLQWLALFDGRGPVGWKSQARFWQRTVRPDRNDGKELERASEKLEYFSCKQNARGNVFFTVALALFDEIVFACLCCVPNPALSLYTRKTNLFGAVSVSG